MIGGRLPHAARALVSERQLALGAVGLAAAALAVPAAVVAAGFDGELAMVGWAAACAMLIAARALRHPGGRRAPWLIAAGAATGALSFWMAPCLWYVANRGALERAVESWAKVAHRTPRPITLGAYLAEQPLARLELYVAAGVAAACAIAPLVAAAGRARRAAAHDAGDRLRAIAGATLLAAGLPSAVWALARPTRFALVGLGAAAAGAFLGGRALRRLGLRAAWLGRVHAGVTPGWSIAPRGAGDGALLPYVGGAAAPDGGAREYDGALVYHDPSSAAPFRAVASGVALARLDGGEGPRAIPARALIAAAAAALLGAALIAAALALFGAPATPSAPGLTAGW